MRGGRIALVPVVFLAGCLGGDDDAERQSPRQVADEWVAALNDGDYARACGLSFLRGKLCIDYLRSEPFGTKLRTEAFTVRDHGRQRAIFGLSSARARRQAGRLDGWTAYAPLNPFRIVEDRDALRVLWSPAEIVTAEGIFRCKRGFHRVDWRRKRGVTGRSIAACHWLDDASRPELLRALGEPDDRRGRFLDWELDTAQAGIGPTAWFLEVALDREQERVVWIRTRVRSI